MMITRIQYWNRPFSALNATSPPANHASFVMENSRVRESTAVPMMIGCAA